MRSHFAFLLLVLFALPQLGNAQPLCVEKDNLHNAVLVSIAEKAETPRIAIWDKSISANELVERKVQGHWPKGQFSKSMSGVSLDMEMELLYVSQRPPYNIFADEYIWAPPAGVEFLGVVGAASIPNIKGVTVIKLSRVGFNDRQSKGLVYAETFVTGYEQSGGYAFLFERSRNAWCLKNQVPLWHGGKPLWLDNDD